jgi:large subunit ribosomal protein L19e
MGMNSQKRIAADLLKCGVSRVRIEAAKEVEEALTREDIRNLIKKGMIKKIRKKGQNRAKTRKLQLQKKLGRRKGPGSRKGSKFTRNPRKRAWIKRVRPLRMLLTELKENEQIKKKDYRRIYLQIKGGMFRDKKHLLLYLKEHELLRAKPKKAKAKSGKK